MKGERTEGVKVDPTGKLCVPRHLDALSIPTSALPRTHIRGRILPRVLSGPGPSVKAAKLRLNVIFPYAIITQGLS